MEPQTEVLGYLPTTHVETNTNEMHPPFLHTYPGLVYHTVQSFIRVFIPGCLSSCRWQIHSYLITGKPNTPHWIPILGPGGSLSHISATHPCTHTSKLVPKWHYAHHQILHPWMASFTRNLPLKAYLCKWCQVWNLFPKWCLVSVWTLNSYWSFS